MPIATQGWWLLYTDDDRTFHHQRKFYQTVFPRALQPCTHPCVEKSSFSLSTRVLICHKGEGHLTHLWSGAPLCHTDKTPGHGPSAPAVPHTWSHFLDGSSQNHCKSPQIKYLLNLLKDSNRLAMQVFVGQWMVNIPVLGCQKVAQKGPWHL